MDRRFFNDNYMGRIGRVAIVALARHPLVADASDLDVERLVGMALAHPSYVVTDQAIFLHR